MAALPVPVLAPAVFPTPDLATEDEISAIAWCQNNGLIARDRRRTHDSRLEELFVGIFAWSTLLGIQSS